MNKYISSGPILTLSPRESTYVLLTSLFDSNLANFDEMFAPKWSSKDLIIESIKLITRDSWFYPSISEDNKLTKIQSWTTKQNNSEFGQDSFFLTVESKSNWKWVRQSQIKEITVPQILTWTFLWLGVYSGHAGGENEMLPRFDRSKMPLPCSCMLFQGCFQSSFIYFELGNFVYFEKFPCISTPIYIQEFLKTRSVSSGVLSSVSRLVSIVRKKR